MSRPSSPSASPRRLLPLVLIPLASLAASTTAQAADSGLLQFPNVRVVDAPAMASTPSTTQAGWMAFKDPVTGELRAATAEELQTAAATRTFPAARRAAETAAPTSFASAGGGVGVTLDESFLQYSMVVRQPDGTLAEVCVTGPEAAEAVIKAGPSAGRTQGISKTEAAHDR